MFVCEWGVRFITSHRQFNSESDAVSLIHSIQPPDDTYLLSQQPQLDLDHHQLGTHALSVITSRSRTCHLLLSLPLLFLHPSMKHIPVCFYLS